MDNNDSFKYEALRIFPVTQDPPKAQPTLSL